MSELRETRIRDNVFVWTLGGEEIPTSYGANCVGVIGESGVLLVDPLIAPRHARLVETALREKTGLPVRFVVLTHHHTDHALGSSWFARQGATIVAHEECARAMAAEHPDLIASRRLDPALADLFSDAGPVRPGMTFDDRVTLALGGSEAIVVHPGHGHTRGDAMIHLPKESVAVCGDLVSRGYHVNVEHASLSGLGRSWKALRGLDTESYVPGHGVAGGKEIVDGQKRYFDAVREAIRENVAAGGPSEDAVSAIRNLFPGFLLETVLPETVRRFSEG